MFWACSVTSSFSFCGVLSRSSVLSFPRGKTSFIVVTIRQIRVSPLSCLVSSASYGKSPLSGVFSSPHAGKPESASAAWCFILARWTLSNSNADGRRRNRASLPVLCVTLKIHFIEVWPVLMVNSIPFRYGRNNSTAHTIARHTSWTISFYMHCLMETLTDSRLVYSLHRFAVVRKQIQLGRFKHLCPE